jgi:hypothetical protein
MRRDNMRDKSNLEEEKNNVFTTCEIKDLRIDNDNLNLLNYEDLEYRSEKMFNDLRKNIKKSIQR